jgi:hypothetical protein
LNKIVPGAADVATWSPTTSGHEAIPTADSVWPSSVIACLLVIFATGADAPATAQKPATSVMKPITRPIETSVEKLPASIVWIPLKNKDLVALEVYTVRRLSTLLIAASRP